MSQGSHRFRFWDITLVWKFWVFEEESGERFGCNNGKNTKYGKIWVKFRFGCKVSQIWKIQILPKNSNISEYEVVPKFPGWEDRNLMLQGSYRTRFWDFSLNWKIRIFEEGSESRFGGNSCKIEEFGWIVVKVRFGYKVSQIWKIQIIPKYSNISEYEVVPKSPGWEDRNLMSQGRYRAKFWDFSLISKKWLFEERSGERFACNSGKSQKLGKIVVKFRFGFKISQI